MTKLIVTQPMQAIDATHSQAIFDVQNPDQLKRIQLDIKKTSDGSILSFEIKLGFVDIEDKEKIEQFTGISYEWLVMKIRTINIDKDTVPGLPSREAQDVIFSQVVPMISDKEIVENVLPLLKRNYLVVESYEVIFRKEYTEPYIFTMAKHIAQRGDIKFEGKTFSVYYWLGSFYGERKDTEAAIKAYSLVSTTSRSYKESQFELAKLNPATKSLVDEFLQLLKSGKQAISTINFNYRDKLIKNLNKDVISFMVLQQSSDHCLSLHFAALFHKNKKVNLTEANLTNDILIKVSYDIFLKINKFHQNEYQLEHGFLASLFMDFETFERDLVRVFMDSFPLKLNEENVLKMVSGALYLSSQKFQDVFYSVGSNLKENYPLLAYAFLQKVPKENPNYSQASFELSKLDSSVASQFKQVKSIKRSLLNCQNSGEDKIFEAVQCNKKLFLQPLLAFNHSKEEELQNKIKEQQAEIANLREQLGMKKHQASFFVPNP